MWNLADVADYIRYLLTNWFVRPENKMMKCDDNGRVEDPSVYFTPEEQVARMDRVHSVFSGGAVDPISPYGHGWYNFQHGMDPGGKPIDGALQNALVVTPDKQFTIQGTTQTVLAVPTEMVAQVAEMAKSVKDLLEQAP